MTADTESARTISGRQPQMRVVRNDSRILDAAFATACDEGWRGVTFSSVARRAGLSRRPVQERFETTSALMAATWTERAYPLLLSLTETALATSGTLGTSLDESAFLHLMETIALPTPTRTGAMELLLVAQFEPELREAVDRTLGQRLRQLLDPTVLDGTLAARRSYVLSLALGLILNSQRPGVERFDISDEVRRIGRALTDPAPVSPLPDRRAEHMDHPPAISTGDPIRDALLTAVLNEVGDHGFDGTSVARIVRAAQSSQGAMFARFPSKLALFIEATHRHDAMNLRLNEQFMQSIAAEASLGIAEAVYIREVQRPERAHPLALVLEQLRLSWHDADLMAARTSAQDAFDREYVQAHLGDAPDRSVQDLQGAAHVGNAIGYGIGIPSLFVPWAYELPHQVVTVALMG